MVSSDWKPWAAVSPTSSATTSHGTSSSPSLGKKPPESAAYYYFSTWRDDGTDQKIHDLMH
jgi:hypothetical protein